MRIPSTLRAGIIVGPGSAAYEVMRDLVYHLPLMVTPRWVRSKSSPIALANLLEYLVRLATLPQAEGRIFDAGGPDYMSYAEMMRAFGEVIGKRPRLVPVPVLTPQLSSYWLALVTTVPASIARALIGGLKHDIPADDGPLRELVPQQLLPFREAVAAALAAERTHTVAARWTEGALMFRGGRHDYAFYAKRAAGSAVARATPAAIWDVVTRLGGEVGYFYAAPLWKVRAWIDWLAGGPGLTKGRRHPTELRIGDTIDYWTVMALEPHAGDRHRLLAPAGGVGAAVLVRAGAGAPFHLQGDDAGDRAAGGARRTGGRWPPTAPGVTPSYRRRTRIGLASLRSTYTAGLASAAAIARIRRNARTSSAPSSAPLAPVATTTNAMTPAVRSACSSIARYLIC